MTYRLVSLNDNLNFSYCKILWIVLACIALYTVHSGVLKRQNVQVGVMNTDSYEHFTTRGNNRKFSNY